jgi:hypothetical protein
MDSHLLKAGEQLLGIKSPMPTHMNILGSCLTDLPRSKTWNKLLLGGVGADGIACASIGLLPTRYALVQS